MLEPDILFVGGERLSILRERRLEGVADLVVEILSPWTRNYDMQEKRRAYHSAGVEELWFVNYHPLKRMACSPRCVFIAYFGCVHLRSSGLVELV